MKELTAILGIAFLVFMGVNVAHGILTHDVYYLVWAIIDYLAFKNFIETEVK